MGLCDAEDYCAGSYCKDCCSTREGVVEKVRWALCLTPFRCDETKGGRS